jgi:hypothetical protein
MASKDRPFRETFIRRRVSCYSSVLSFAGCTGQIRCNEAAGKAGNWNQRRSRWGWQTTGKGVQFVFVGSSAFNMATSGLIRRRTSRGKTGSWAQNPPSIAFWAANVAGKTPSESWHDIYRVTSRKLSLQHAMGMLEEKQEV